MKTNTKILISLLILTFIGSIIAIWIAPPTGGAYLDYLETWWLFSLSIIFLVSLINIAYDLVKNRVKIFPIITLIISIPVIYGFINNSYSSYKLNLQPDLKPKYARPVNQESYLKDSLFIQKYIVNQALTYNNQYGGSDILETRIDTIIYSESGEKIFIVYAKFFEENNLEKNINAGYLIGHEKIKGEWKLNSPTINYHISSNSFENLKEETRKALFNRYEFGENFKGTRKYFWEKIENK